MMPIQSMTVTDAEEMKTQLAKHVWNQDVLVLVLLVWVAWLVANAGSEGELCDAVEPFGCYFWFDLCYWLLFLDDLMSIAVGSNSWYILHSRASRLSFSAVLSREEFPLELDLISLFRCSC